MKSFKSFMTTLNYSFFYLIITAIKNKKEKKSLLNKIEFKSEFPVVT